MAYQAVIPAPKDVLASSTRIITADLTAPIQSNWLGVCANYSVLPGFGLTAGNKTTEWDRLRTSGIKIVSSWYDTGWAYTSGYPTGSPDYLSAKMTEVYAWLQALKDRGIKVMFKMGWHFPQNIGAPSGTAPITPTPANEATFAAWVSESLNQFLNVRAFTNLIGCFFFTEPSTNQAGTIPGGYASAQEYYAHIVTVVRDKIVADDASRTPIRSRIILAGPSEQSFTNDTWTEYLTANVPTLLDGYGAHSYANTPGFAPLGLTQVSNYQQWKDLFADWVGDASPKTMSADESGFIVGGDSDTTGYRATADAGWQWCRLIEGHMEVGIAASYIWLLFDQPILGDIVTGPVLKYGTTQWIKTASTVKPSWYAISMLANLTGGGSGTKLYACKGGTSALVHAIAAFVPYGVAGAVNTAGEWTIVVINEGSATTVLPMFSSAIGTAGRTFYRYTQSGETPPTAAADPAYLLPWGMKFTGVTTGIPPTVIPGHSVVCFSTMEMATPVAPNLALTATASSDSTGSGAAANVNDGNFSNYSGNLNGWKKADDGSHYVQLDWPSAVSIARLELAFAATTVGVVYADGATTGTPSPLADYTVKYFNGSAYTDFSTPVSVTGNTSPNRTHTFNAVSTTSIQLTATSVAATAWVNQLGAYGS